MRFLVLAATLLAGCPQIERVDQLTNTALRHAKDGACVLSPDIRIDRAEQRYVETEGVVVMWDCSYRLGDTLGDWIVRSADERTAILEKMLDAPDE